MRRKSSLALLLLLTLISGCLSQSAEGEWIPDPSFEEPRAPDQFRRVFAKWEGWIYEGQCEFRVGTIAHSGKYSCLLFGSNAPKIRVFVVQKSLAPGRYRITGYLRGLDIGEGQWGQTTEFAFGERYIPLHKNGTFGWTKLTYVADVKERGRVYGPSFGLMAPGYLWVDDVTMEQVGPEVPLTPEPVLGQEESPIAPPAELSATAVRCRECGYRNMPAWGSCYACGTDLTGTVTITDGPPVKKLTSFEARSPFSGGRAVTSHATDGSKAWVFDKGYTDWSGPQDWSGYQYLKADLYTDSPAPMELQVEIRDKLTRDYWTRVNYNTVVPPGSSTFVLPLDQLYVGEKARPGRNLLTGAVTRLVFSIGDQAPAPLYLDNLRLERDVETPRVLFEGLYAFDLGEATSPLMPGFTRLDASVRYAPGRGYGLKDAKVWRSYDVRQPDPLYQDFLCLESGGLAIDLPNGQYHVFVNMDNPSGYWGEYQRYKERSLLAEGTVVARDVMSFTSLKEKYYRFWNTEDVPEDNTFDKYQDPYYSEKELDVEVRDGQLNVEFTGSDWACSVSAIVVYPVEQAAAGRRFLDHVRQQRRFFFDNYFKRVLHAPSGERLQPTAADEQRGYVLFTRDYMQDVYYNDMPRQGEIAAPIEGFAFAGEIEPLTVSIYPLRDLGTVRVRVSDLASSQDTIPASAIEVGTVSHRISRVTMEGTVYTLRPRLIMPTDETDIAQGMTRRFWLTLRVPGTARSGLYEGTLTVTPQNGQAASLPLRFRVFAGTLDPVDIPVGPWGHQISVPWYDDDPATGAWRERMTRQSLAKLREYGFTSFSGLPVIHYHGMRDGRVQLDFAEADAQMKRAREMGFSMPIVNYCPFGGLNLYYKDKYALERSGLREYDQLVRAVFSAIQRHAEANDWLPVYWNLGDEPLGDDVKRATENAQAYRKAFPQGPPRFTAATSLGSANANDPHFRFAEALHVANLNTHSEAGIRMLQKAGSDWAFYNGGNRWTYGVYLYKAAKQFDMKFRLSWHWNVVAGDPYYALDCREDDYAWCNSSPDGRLIPSLHFEREMREGIDDYRYLLTLSRLGRETGSRTAQRMIDERMAAFQLGQRDHNALFPASDWRVFRRSVAQAIESLQKNTSR